MATIEDVTFPASEGHPMRAALARADALEPRPGVIMIHEIFGLNDDIRSQAARMADLGYVVLVPDLFDRPAPRALCVVRTMVAIRRGEGPAFADLDAARRWLGARPDVDASRMGVGSAWVPASRSCSRCARRSVQLRSFTVMCRNRLSSLPEYVLSLPALAGAIASTRNMVSD